MNSISEREQKFLMNWAENSKAQNCTVFRNTDVNSYYIDRVDESTYLMEYDFNKPIDFEEQMKSIYGEKYSEELYRTCMVAALKECDTRIEKKEEGIEEKQTEIPSFIYNF